MWDISSCLFGSNSEPIYYMTWFPVTKGCLILRSTKSSYFGDVTFQSFDRSYLSFRDRHRTRSGPCKAEPWMKGGPTREGPPGDQAGLTGQIGSKDCYFVPIRRPRDWSTQNTKQQQLSQVRPDSTPSSHSAANANRLSPCWWRHHTRDHQAKQTELWTYYTRLCACARMRVCERL